MNPQKRLAAVVAVLVVSSIVAPVAIAQTTGEGQVLGWPQLSVTTSTSEVTPGGEQSLTLEILNDPDLRQAGPERYEQRVTTARAVRVDIDDGDVPFDIRPDSVTVGDVPPGKTNVPPISVTVPESVSPGSYTIPVEVTYSYTRLVSYDGDDISYADGRRTVTDEVTVRVSSQPRFVVVDTQSDIQVGDTGRVTVTFENAGSETARDARVSLSSSSANARITTSGGEQATGPAGQSPSTTAVYLGTWRAGETRSATFTAAVDENTDVESLAFRARVLYEDTDGVEQTARPLTFGVRPRPEQSFALETVQSTLRVGRTGSLSGTVVNTGETTVGNAVVVLSTASPELVPQPTRVAVSNIEPGGRASFSFDVRVSEEAAATTHQAELTVQYRNQRGQLRRSDPLETPIEVSPQRDRFSLTPVNATFEVDTDNRFAVRITNRESITYREVRVGINATDPFTSESPTAYVEEVAPGESATLFFEVTVSEDAVPTTTAIEATVTAREPDGDRIRDGPYVVSATVTEQSGPGNTALLGTGVLVLVLVIGAGWWWLRR